MVDVVVSTNTLHRWWRVPELAAIVWDFTPLLESDCRTWVGVDL